MPDWYLNPALTRFRGEVNSRWPRRDKTSDGTIGDAAHQETDSDHNPDRDGSVDAWDMDIDGVDVRKVIDAAIAHESIQYIIYNRKITSRSWGLGTWRPYTGKSPHTEHVHFNTRQSHERSTKPWGIWPIPAPPKPPAPEVPMTIRLQSKQGPAQFLDNGRHITNSETAKEMADAGVPLIQVDTDAELASLLPLPTGSEVTLNPAQLAQITQQVVAAVVTSLKTGAFVFEEIEVQE